MTSVYNPEAKRAYYLANRERIKEQHRLFYIQNAERLRAVQRARPRRLAPEQKQKLRERSKKWYQDNKTKALEQAREYHKAHPEVSQKAVAAYCARNREKLRQKSREFYRNNRESEILRCINSNRAREARKRETQSNPKAIREWMARIRQLPFVRCHWCGTKISGRAVHFDHVIALATGGTHEIANLCAACPECNHSKSAKRLENWMANGQKFFNL